MSATHPAASSATSPGDVPNGSAASPYLVAPPGAILARTAAPIILVMTLSGSLNIVDAAFLGWYVGPSAVAAVSAIFPVFALLIALSTMVGSGMASLLARRLGAGDVTGARALLASAHGLALALSLVLAAGFALAGAGLTRGLAGGAGPVADMAWRYLAILVGAAPVMFWLGLQVDALRSEGRAMLMAGLSVLVTLVNLALNYVLIARLGLGVAGSAIGTAAAQALALGLALAARGRIDTPLPLAALLAHRWWGGWPRILALGAPLSLNFLGLALVATVIITTLQATAAPDYVTTLAAYGLVTRLMGFVFLPLMGLAQAMQSITGNNVGAGLPARSDRVLGLSLAAGLAYGLGVEAAFLGLARAIGGMFTDDPAIIAELGRILRPMMALYALSAPILLLALYFQAVGQAGRAALLTLSKPYLLQPPLIVALGWALGPQAIWYALPLADALLIALALGTWWRLRRPGRPGFALATGP